MNNLKVLGLLFLLTSCGQGFQSVCSYGYVTHGVSSGDTCYLSDDNTTTENTLKFYISNSNETFVKNAILEAANIWNNAAGKQLIKVVETNISNDTDFAKMNELKYHTLTFKYNWPSYLADNKLAVTNSITIKKTVNDIETETFTKKSIYINFEKYIFYTGNNSSCSYGFDLVSVMAHEFGHAIGLGESSNQNAIMGSKLGSCAERRNITSTDLNMLRSLY